MTSFKINEIIASLKSTYGQDFLDTITMQLHKAIDADYTFIAKLDKERHISKTLSLTTGKGEKGDFGNNFEYALAHTPCADVSNNDTCIIPTDVNKFYPKDQLLIDMGITGYIGAPITNSKGEVFGIVVALYEQQIESPQDVCALFELFAGRIAAEIERSENEQKLIQLNNSLEEKVAARNQELLTTLTQLKTSQAQLVEQAKLASLGRLVAGIAHEINSPLGVAILASTTGQSYLEEMAARFNDNKLSKSDLYKYIQNATESYETTNMNLERARALVGNFKQMATDTYGDRKCHINLTEWLPLIAESLKPLLWKADIMLNLELPEKPVEVSIYSTRLSQVISNLVSNVVNHAYPDSLKRPDRVLNIKLTDHDSSYAITIADKGVGMSEDVQNNVLEPFYTTDRSTGGTGLGMSIANNLITSSLKGTMAISSKELEGTEVTLTFKKPLKAISDAMEGSEEFSL